MNKYKVGDKIVLTVSDVNEKAYYSYYVFNNNDLILWEPSTDKYAEPLSTYTEPLERKNENKQKQIEKLVDKLHRQAAEITRLLAENKELKNKEQELTRERNQLMGRCGGLSAARIKEFNNGRLAGQNEAWELVRKIFDMETNDIEDIFITEDAWNLGTVLNNYTYQEAATKVAEWERAKEEEHATAERRQKVIEAAKVIKEYCNISNCFSCPIDCEESPHPFGWKIGGESDDDV